jgi:hypothetical protein
MSVYFFSPQSFHSPSLLNVTERNFSIPLKGLKVQFLQKILSPVRGLSNLLRAFVNDNLLESSCDNHLDFSNSLNQRASTHSLIRGLVGHLFNFSHSSIVRSSDSLGLFYKKPLNLQESNRNNQIISSARIILSNSLLGNRLYDNPTLFKFFLWNQYNLNTLVADVLPKPLMNSLLADLGKFNFSTRTSLYQNSNLWPAKSFNYSIRRKVLKMITYNKFVPNISMWYHNTLVRFIEHYSGKRVYLRCNPFIQNYITYEDASRCILWELRVFGFQRILGPKIFVRESLRILVMALRFKDPTFLSNWIKAMLYRMNFFKYRLLFRYIKFTMRYLFSPCFPELDFKGFKLTLKGKISVAGNARTRTLFYAIGETSNSTMNNRVLSDFTTIHTFTGVMGFRLTFYF